MNTETAELVKGLLLKNKDGSMRIRKTKPKGLAGAAWLGCMAAWNPYKLSIGAVLFLDQEERAVFDEVSKWAENHPELRGLDRDRLALEQLGAW